MAEEDTTGKMRRFIAGGTLLRQSHVSRDAFCALLKRLNHSLTDAQVDILLAGVNRAATAYTMARERSTSRVHSERPWRADDLAILKNANRLADNLCKVLAQLPVEAVRSLDGAAPGTTGILSAAAQSAQSAKAALEKVSASLPELSPTRASLPEQEVFVHALAKAWLDTMGQHANRGINREGFCAFAEEVARRLKVKISRGQIEENVIRLQRETAGN